MFFFLLIVSVYSAEYSWSQCPENACRHDLSTRTVDGKTETKSCSEQKCVNWQIGRKWSPCSQRCNSGVQTRHVECMREQKEYVNESFCVEKKPADEQDCYLQPCDGWNVTKWGPCSTSCGPGIEIRNVSCIDIIDNCIAKEQPITQQTCQIKNCPFDCIVSTWSLWTSCQCSHGQQTQHQNRTRNITKVGRYGGKSCPFLYETQECPQCKQTTTITNTKRTSEGAPWIPAIIGFIVVMGLAYIFIINC